MCNWLNFWLRFMGFNSMLWTYYIIFILNVNKFNKVLEREIEEQQKWLFYAKTLLEIVHTENSYFSSKLNRLAIKKNPDKSNTAASQLMADIANTRGDKKDHVPPVEEKHKLKLSCIQTAECEEARLIMQKCQARLRRVVVPTGETCDRQILSFWNCFERCLSKRKSEDK